MDSWRGIRGEAAVSAGAMLHAIIAWTFWAILPFTRLVHAWSLPFQS